MRSWRMGGGPGAGMLGWASPWKWGWVGRWGWRLLKGTGAVRANPAMQSPAHPGQPRALPGNILLFWSQHRAGGTSGLCSPQRTRQHETPSFPIFPGMLQRDQVRFDISPRVLEAPGAVTDNHNALFSHIL